MRRFCGRAVRRFGTSHAPPLPSAQPPTPPVFVLQSKKRSLLPRVLLGVAGFVVGGVVGVEVYSYFFAPPRSHKDQLAFILQSYGSATQSRNVIDADVSRSVANTDTMSRDSARAEAREKEGGAAVEQVAPSTVQEEASHDVAETSPAETSAVETSDVAPVVEEESVPQVVLVVVAAPSAELLEPAAAVAVPEEEREEEVAIVPIVVVVEEKEPEPAKRSNDGRQAVAMLSAQLVEQAAVVAAKNEEIEGLKLDNKKLEREMERKIAVIRQDMEAEYVAALESRVEIERLAAEDRKNRDVAAELALQDKELERAIEREEKRLRAEARRESRKRMELLTDLYEEIEAAEQLMGSLSLRVATSAKAYEASQLAAKARDSLRMHAPFGKASPKALLTLRENEDPIVREVAEAVPTQVLERGVATDEYLLSEFDKCAKKALRLALVKTDKGLLGMVGSVLGVLVRPAEGMVEGDDADAVLARARVFLQHDETGAALEQIAQLKAGPREACEEFVDLATERLIVDNAVQLIEAHARVQMSQ